MIYLKTRCPKCGSRDISRLIAGLSGRGEKSGKRYPEPYNDEPPEHYLPPIIDFNHTHHCNTCGYSFGGS